MLCNNSTLRAPRSLTLIWHDYEEFGLASFCANRIVVLTYSYFCCHGANMSHDKNNAFLDKEMECIYNYQISLSNMRHGILGACLTFVGLLISFVKPNDIVAMAGVHAAVLLAVFTTIQMIGAINRGLFVFGSHLKWIQERYGSGGFWTYWPYYLDRHDKHDSVTHSFVVVLRIMNYSVPVYVLGWLVVHFEFIVGIRDWVLACLLILLVLGVTWYNRLYIVREVDPAGFRKRIQNGLDEARQFSESQLPHPRLPPPGNPSC